MATSMQLSWLDPEPRTAVEQFLCRAVDALQREGVPFWLCGGYALEAHVGRAMRAHKDVDLLALAADRPRLCALLSGSTTLLDDSDTAVLVVYEAGRCVADIVLVEEHPAGFVYLRTSPGVFPLPPGSLTDGPDAQMWGRQVSVVSATCLYAQKARRRPADLVGPADSRREGDLALLRAMLSGEQVEAIERYCGL